MNKNGFLCTHWTGMDVTSTAPGRPEDTRIGFLLCPLRTTEPTMSIRATWCQDKGKMPVWLHRRVTEREKAWEAVLETAVPVTTWSLLITPLDEVTFFQCGLLYSSFMVLVNIMIYFACAVLDGYVPWFLSFHATCDDHMRYLKRFEKHERVCF